MPIRGWLCRADVAFSGDGGYVGVVQASDKSFRPVCTVRAGRLLCGLRLSDAEKCNKIGIIDKSAAADGGRPQLAGPHQAIDGRPAQAGQLHRRFDGDRERRFGGFHLASSA
jgi:hypothetical protein